MEQRTLNIELRTATGKGISRRLRMAGRLPAIVYGKGMEPVNVSVDQKELAAIMAGAGGQNALVALQGLEGLNGAMIIVADLNREPIKGLIRHADLHKVNLDEKVRVEVKITLVGTAKGVKDGGLLDFPHHTVELECLPALIPDQISVDVAGLGIGQSIHVGDLQLPAGVRAVTDAKASVVSILGKREAAAAE
ncbi:MAG TPA: 50S ribosomal protein L25 [Geobacteraceae bacterium]